ncbi:MAG: RNA-binding S4 domain-containing protein [Candidatus Pelethousia sp.]|nr:RNA-binding S4 domain-containing protein [Candidatus Pelethousia sp.]
MRLDKYLKISRLIKRRTVANEACGLGRVQINGRVAKASSEVKEGDELDILLSGKHVRLRVLSVQEHALKADASSMYALVQEGDS